MIGDFACQRIIVIGWFPSNQYRRLYHLYLQRIENMFCWRFSKSTQHKQPSTNTLIKCLLLFSISSFGLLNRDISKIRILVPGAGLGRLTYELAYRGFYCEGNEFSLFMLVASNFVLNKCVVENQYTMFPWVHQFVNNLSRSDQIRAVSFPDVSPTIAKPKGGFNMVAGDFLQVFLFLFQMSHMQIDVRFFL